MPLENCPECGRQISTVAEACPQCGHPLKAGTTITPAGPKCYACAAAATTQCPSCGALSCVSHLERINYGLGPKILCESCRTSHKGMALFRWVLLIVAVGGPLIGWLVFAAR